MRVIIVGCGRLGVNLASSLAKKNVDIAIIDSTKLAFSNLPADFQGITVEGDALNQDVLIRAGIEKAEALVAATNCDALNAVVAHIARSVYQVPHVVVRNYDPRWREFEEMLSLQVISSTSWGAQRIEELIHSESFRTVFSAGNGEVEIYEFEVPAEWNDHCLGELITSDECVPVSLTRAGTAMIPTHDTTVHTDDVILFSGTMNGSFAVRDQLGRK